ncbi:hypothetical protein EV421DRAFT_1913079 [Armillaria borealis]|uniref:Uncharacterized protein n=1 Tax=Armillaria borealis TaxID=47425 RepID=A0AA39ITL9_9AGAR|nr:hypothetical protein EV421DRAFT_1913079 [Armillaria borealis]
MPVCTCLCCRQRYPNGKIVSDSTYKRHNRPSWHHEATFSSTLELETCDCEELECALNRIVSHASSILPRKRSLDEVEPDQSEILSQRKNSWQQPEDDTDVSYNDTVKHLHTSFEESDDSPDPGCLEELEAEEHEDEDTEDDTEFPPTSPSINNSIDNDDRLDGGRHDSFTLDGYESDTSDSECPHPKAHIDDIIIAHKFIDALKAASHADINPDILDQITDPPQYTPTLDPDDQLSLNVLLSVTNASEQTYTSVAAAIMHHFAGVKVHSFYKAKKLLNTVSGVAPEAHDMCIKSCVGFTGPFAGLEICPYCGEDQYTQPGSSIP